MRTLQSPAIQSLCAAILLALCSAAVAISADKETPPFDVDQWLNGSTSGEIPWQVEINEPSLTLQQRYLVEVRASIDGSRLRSSHLHRNLHFVVKVADADNRWFPDYNYTRVGVAPGIDKWNQIEYASALYLCPGRYTVALIVYDDALNIGNIHRKRLTITRPRRDPLPELDRDFPEVEFISDASQEPIWPLSASREWLPVKSNRDICLDIVVNISTAYAYSAYWRRETWIFDYKENASRAMQISSVLSHLGLSSGCVRVSILDISRMKTLFDREDAASFDWQKASEIVLKQDWHVIDSDILRSQTQISAFLFDRLNRILQDDTHAAGARPPLKAVILVSCELPFAANTIIEDVVPQDPSVTRFFYFCINASSDVSDDLVKMLRRAKPRRFLIEWPPSFRKSLAALLRSLETIR